MGIVPDARPKLEAERVREIGARHGVKDPVYIVGVRGYYEDSMGVRDANDRGIYDDAMFLVTPDGVYRYNANTDPSKFRRATKSQPGMATLLLGVHRYVKGKHGISRGAGYDALVPAAAGKRVPVTRDGQTGEAVGVALNIHRGGNTTTSSEGCQTIPPAQWAEFVRKVYRYMDLYQQRTIAYVLVSAREIP